MSDKIYLGNRLADLDIGEPSLPVSKVILSVDGETYYKSGDDTGLTIEQNCPWATQAMADSVLSKLRGFVYRPYIGTDALLDPAAELGDALTVGGEYVVLAQMGRTLDRQSAATVGAPGTDEIADEYPYKSKQRKEIDRVLAKSYSRISKTASEIRLEVSALEQSVGRSLSALEDSFGEDLEGLELSLGKDLEELELSLGKDISDLGTSFNTTLENYATLLVTDEKIETAVSNALYITSTDEEGNTIKSEKYSTVEQTSSSIKSAISEALYVTTTDEDGNEVVTEKYSTVEQTASSISSAVSGLINGTQAQTLINQTIDALEFSVSSSGGATSFKLTGDGVEVSAENVSLSVDAVNITGRLVASQIDASELKVDAANITGKLTLDKIASISFSDLSDTEDVATKDDIPTTTSQLTNDSGYVNSANLTPTVTQITYNAISTASISANQISTGTLKATNDYGQTAISMSGLLGLMYSGSYYGYVGASTAGSYAGAVLTDSTMSNYFIATTGGARMSAANAAEIYVISGTYAGCYSTHQMQVASDKRLKDRVVYGLENYEELFKSLKPCSYYLNNETVKKRHWGFVAQDFQTSIEDCNLTEPLAVLGFNGEYYSVGYGEVTALNTHMIQKIIKALAEVGVNV